MRFVCPRVKCHRPVQNGDDASAGLIRYNAEQDQFEGFGAGNAWGSLGGVKDVDQIRILPKLLVTTMTN